jgi:hypothetical protein
MLLLPDQLRSLPAPARRGLLLSKRDQKQADRKAVEVVTVVGDIVRPWLGRCARQPRVAESFHELLATNVTLDQARSSEHLPKRDEQLPRSRRVVVGKLHGHVRLVDSRTVSPGRQ